VIIEDASWFRQAAERNSLLHKTLLVRGIRQSYKIRLAVLSIHLFCLFFFHFAQRAR